MREDKTTVENVRCEWAIDEKQPFIYGIFYKGKMTSVICPDRKRDYTAQLVEYFLCGGTGNHCHLSAFVEKPDETQ